jgi:hypothetical protein
MLAAGQYLLELTDPKQDHPVLLAAQLQETAAAWLDWAEPDFIQTWLQSAAPNDTYYGNQWHLQNTGQGAPAGIATADSRTRKAWDAGVTGNGSIIIAVVDDGVQSAHPDLNVSNARQNLCGKTGDAYGWNFVDDNNASDPVASPSHGTAVAGVAAAIGNNGQGVTGACQNCPVVSARIFSGGTSTSSSNIANAIAYAACTADVINNSWGGGSESPAITAAVQNAIAGTGDPAPKRGSKGTPVLFATGNSGSGYTLVPVTVQNAGTYTLEWRYEKDGSVSSGYDTAWLDYVIFPTAVPSGESFEGTGTCALPGAWTSTGNAPWSIVDAEVRAASLDGGHCSIKAGTIGDGQSSGIKVTMTLVPGTLYFSAWVSSEPLGPIQTTGCFDKLSLYANGSPAPVVSLCGTYSNQGTPLADGTITYPASIPGAIAVGAATNFDRRSDYSQWGPGITLLAHSGGGTLDIATTDYLGPTGYSTDNTGSMVGVPDYTNTFSGTSSATPLAAGIVALYLTQNPGATAATVKTALQSAVRKIGCETYPGNVGYGYGYGVLDAERLLTGGSLGIDNPNPCPGGSNLASYNPNISSTFLTGSKPAGGATNSVSGGGDNAACMIAFLTQGWLPDHYLNPLRQVRGWLIAQGPWGRSLVRGYYRTSATLIRWLEAPTLSAAVLGAP